MPSYPGGGSTGPPPKSLMRRFEGGAYSTFGFAFRSFCFSPEALTFLLGSTSVGFFSVKWSGSIPKMGRRIVSMTRPHPSSPGGWRRRCDARWDPGRAPRDRCAWGRRHGPRAARWRRRGRGSRGGDGFSRVAAWFGDEGNRLRDPPNITPGVTVSAWNCVLTQERRALILSKARIPRREVGGSGDWT